MVKLAPFGGELENFWNRFFDETSYPGINLQKCLPSVDISENKNKVLVKADLPGLDAKDVSVSVSGNVLTIKGEKKKEEEERGHHYYHCERYRGWSFKRSFQ